jgi:hypothetical protein
MLDNKNKHMKYALLFLLFPLVAFGQTEVTSDSSYIKNTAGLWYRVTVLKYDDGGTDIRERLIGDTLTLYNQAVDNIRNAASSMAVDASYTSGFPKRVKTILNESDEIALKAGKSPVDSIEAKDLEQFLQPGWTVKSASGSVAITFNKTAQNKLRYQYTTTTNRQTDLIGSVIRLRDFPASGTNTEFYKSPNGKRWTTLGREYQLIPAGGSANR